MANIVRKLKADIITETLQTSSREKQYQKVHHEFKVLPGSRYISLDEFQQCTLLKALEMYFPQLYVGIKFTYTYDIVAEPQLDEFLKVLDAHMSTDSHYKIYGNCMEPHYDFLRQLRLKHMTK